MIETSSLTVRRPLSVLVAAASLSTAQASTPVQPPVDVRVIEMVPVLTPLGQVEVATLAGIQPATIGEDGSVAYIADIAADPDPLLPGSGTERRRNAAFLAAPDGTVTGILEGTETDSIPVGTFIGPFVNQRALRVDSAGRAWFQQGGDLDGIESEAIIVGGGGLPVPERVVFSQENLLDPNGELSFGATFGRPNVNGRFGFFSGFVPDVPIPDAPNATFVAFAEPTIGQTVVAQSVQSLPLSGDNAGDIRVFVPAALDQTRDGLTALVGNIEAPGLFAPTSNGVLVRNAGETGWRVILTEGDPVTGLDGTQQTLAFIAAGVSALTLGGTNAPLPIGGDSVLVVGALLDPVNPFLPGPQVAVLATPNGGRVLAQAETEIPGTGLAALAPPELLDISEDGTVAVFQGAEFVSSEPFLAIADLTAPTLEYELVLRNFDVFEPAGTGQRVFAFTAGISDDGRLHYEVALTATPPPSTEPTQAMVAFDGFGNEWVIFDRQIVRGVENNLRPATNRCGQVIITDSDSNGSLMVLSLPHPDRDCSGAINNADVLTFIEEFNDQRPRADADADGQLTFFDLLAMLNAADAAAGPPGP